MHAVELGCPTHVGIDLTAAEIAEREGRLPHTRGDRPEKILTASGEGTVAPHTWG